jgi:hypothetical protein
MSKARFSNDFKLDAIKQITERGYSVADVSQRYLPCLRCPYAALSRRGSFQFGRMK